MFGFCDRSGDGITHCWIKVNNGPELLVAMPGEYYGNSNVSWTLPVSKDDILYFRMVGNVKGSDTQLVFLPLKK